MRQILNLSSRAFEQYFPIFIFYMKRLSHISSQKFQWRKNNNMHSYGQRKYR